jgi:D-alanyl-D-alanine carboxypeptidase
MSAAALEGLVAETAAGRLLPGVNRCLLRIQTPRWPDGWAAAASTHPDDDADELDVDVAFRIASVTKMVTATALLVLTDQGRCRLDDPAGLHLPTDVVDRFHDSAGRAFGATVTLQQLLDHTSGLPNYFPHPSILDAVRHGGGRRRFSPLDLVDLAAAELPSVAPAGTARTYTDTGFLLAGLIIEALTNRPLHEAYRELVLDPTGMADTWLESSSEAPRRHEIAPHDFERHDISDMDPTVDWAGGGLVSTAADLAAFLRALTGGQLLSGDAWNEMTRWQPGPKGYYDEYGLGLGRYNFPQAHVVGHHGVWGAFAFWSPELDAIITGSLNTGGVDRRPLLGAVVRALTE